MQTTDSVWCYIPSVLLVDRALIKVDNLEKKFISYRKQPGILGSLRTLIKREYIEKKAIENFSLEIKQGEIVGLLGPNGAGKTTLMKMFTGIIVPSAGKISILGYNPWEREKDFRKRIAFVMGQKFQLWWDIPAMDSFKLLQKYYEISPKDFEKRIKLMASIMEVESLLHIHVRKLSLGERMKLELIASLLYNPEVIFLDEPTIGLDLVAQEKIRNFVKDYQRQTNCTIIITSHYMADVKVLCDRLVLVLDGKKEFDGDVEDFENILGDERQVSFKFSEPITSDLYHFTSVDARWNADKTQVDVRIPAKKLRDMSVNILRNFPVVEFHTEKMPIERVMKTLMLNPNMLRGINAKNSSL